MTPVTPTPANVDEAHASVSDKILVLQSLLVSLLASYYICCKYGVSFAWKFRLGCFKLGYTL